jgi:hypothetical protein
MSCLLESVFAKLWHIAGNVRYVSLDHFLTHYCVLSQGFVLSNLSVITSHIYALASFLCVKFSLKNWIIFMEHCVLIQQFMP